MENYFSKVNGRDAISEGDFMSKILEKVSGMSEKEIQKLMYSDDYENLSDRKKLPQVLLLKSLFWTRGCSVSQ